MYEVEVEISFPASHQLTISGLTEPLHEHNWSVRARFSGRKLDADGLLVDFVRVKKHLAQIADNIKGRDLAEMLDLAGRNPSAENVARCFYRRLEGKGTEDVFLAAVTVQEAPGCWATYRP